MPKTKISEFSSTPASNTDIDSINISEGCAPSGINDAIRELMAQLKDFQTGAVGDSFNGPVGSTTAATGAFTTLTTTGTINNLTVGRGAGAVSTNTAVGASALAANTTGAFNTAGGANALAANTSGSASTAFGYNALTLSTGDANNAFGRLAMPATTSGTNNAAFGNNTLQANTTGSYNVALGANALNANTTASNNTAVGYTAAYTNTTAGSITAVGHSALYSNTTGDANTAVGRNSLYANTTGGQNAAVGLQTLYSNTTGSYNTGLGREALFSNTTASNNTAVGYQAGYGSTGAGNTIMGTQAGYSLTSGTYNNLFGYASTGYGAGGLITTGSKNTIIGGFSGNQGGLDIRTSSNHIVLSDGDGNPRGYFNASGSLLVGTTTANSGISLLPSFSSANSSGIDIKHTSTSGSGDYYQSYQYNAGVIGSITQSGTTAVLFNVTSDQRLKENIQDADSASSLIDSLKVRKFDWKSDNTHQRYGFIAQELVTVAPEAVHQPTDTDQMMAVDYSKLVPMLVKEVQSLRKRLADAGL